MTSLKLLLLFPLVTQCVTSLCPEPCTCDVITVTCRYFRLSSVPSRMSPSTWTLDVTGNLIQLLPVSLSRDLPVLKSLRMGSNKLRFDNATVFDGFVNLTDLVLSDNGITTLPLGVFDVLASLQSLDLNGNLIDFEMIDVRIFSKLSKLTHLSIKNNNIRIFPVGMFGNLISLNYLDLSGNHIAHVSPGLFAGLNSLIMLNLGNNSVRFSEADRDAFVGLWNLKHLYLSNNLIESFPETLFSEMNKLQTLQLDDNLFRFSDTDNYVFAGLEKLKSLNLQRNRIEKLPVGVFINQRHLETLRMDSNLVDFDLYDRDLFSSLVSLRVLSISTNRISHLPRGIFRYQSLLKSLYLVNNRISRLLSGAFRGLRILESLTLDGNTIAFNETGGAPFVGLDQLKVLSLVENGIDGIQRGTFDGLTNLRTLRLDNNLVGDVVSGFEALSGLKQLGLSGNRVSSLKLGAFKGLTSLGSLDLRNNSFTFDSTNNTPFDCIANLTSLDLSDNNLETLLPGAFRKLPKLKYLYLSRNAFRNLSTGTFDGLATLKRLHLEDATLTFHDNNLPFRGLKYLQFLHLKGNQINDLPDDIFRDLRFLNFLDLSHNKIVLNGNDERLFGSLSELQYLHMESNHIDGIPPGTFEGLHKLNMLCLDDNYLTFERSTYSMFNNLTHLMDLQIRGNRIGVIPEGLLRHLIALRSLYLSNNNIERIFSKAFEGLRLLDHLDLSWNSIQFGDYDSNSVFDSVPILTYLNLNGNRLTSIPKLLFAKLGELRTLLLANNTIMFPYIDSNVADNNASNNSSKVAKTVVENIRKKWNASNDVNNKQNNTDDNNWTHSNTTSNTDGTGDNLTGKNSTNNAKMTDNGASRQVTMSSIFDGLEKLRMLDLSFNSISDLHPLTFSDNPRLRTLHLDHNALKLSADDGVALGNFHEIDELRLEGNPIRCECDMMAFVRSHYWRVDIPDLDVKAGPRYSLSGTCVSPSLLHSRWIGSITDDEVCNTQGEKWWKSWKTYVIIGAVAVVLALVVAAVLWRKDVFRTHHYRSLYPILTCRWNRH